MGGSKGWAVPDGDHSVTPTYEDTASSVTFRMVPARSDAWVLVSSDPIRSGYTMESGNEIESWRYREVINCSTGAMQVSPNPYSYSIFTASAPVVLSSDTSKNVGQFNGDVYGVPWQGEVWARWNAGQGGFGGACVTESFERK